jgi:DNA helicase-2/ATP-dependent DNA helicase PcrA
VNRFVRLRSLRRERLPWEGLAKAWSWTRSSARLRLRRPASPCWSRAKREPVRPRSPSRGSSTWRAPPTPFRGLYVAPTEALARFVGLSLDRARVEGVEVTSFDALAVRLARRAFRGLPRRVVSEAPAAVIRLKRSDALAHALEGFVAARPRLGDDEDRPGQAAREDLLLLFGDRDGLDVVQGQSSLIRASDVEATLLHTRAQFRLRGEEEFADVVDAARLSALDARSLDAGTPDDLAGSMDVEDIPVLFELARLRG